MDHRVPQLGSSSSNPISKKPRSTASRRPRATDDLTATPHIEPVQQSLHQDNKYASVGKTKELYLNNLPPSSSRKRNGSGSGSNRSTEGLLAPVSYNSSSSLSAENNKLRKVKLKVGGVTRTIHAKTGTETGEVSGDKNKKGEHWFAGTNKGEMYHADSSSEPTRKSRRVPKRRSMDDDMDQDEETKYLEKIRVSKNTTTEFDGVPDEGSKKRRLSKINGNNNNNNIKSTSYEMDEDFMVSRSSNNNSTNRKRGNNNNKEVDLDKEEILGEENGGLEEKHLTSRQRAMQGKGGNGDNLIEFPNGLPPAPSRKQKEKLSDVEIQAKKAEAAQRRKMQVEKAAKEAEAEAIRKILGLDSDKKKEEKKQKEREEREKAAKLAILGSDTVRCVMGPAGTVVTFPDNLGLPSLFDSKPSNYPLPREKCAGPLCKNPYKYRDSKSKLPLCSLQCYKAVQGGVHAPLTC